MSWRILLCSPLLAAGFLALVLRGADSGPAITPPPAALVESLKLDSFYKKHLSIHGLPILASEKVPDAALLEGAWILQQMLGARPEILEAMGRNKVRFAIMAHDEFTTSIPEHRDMKPAPYWDKRARGLGATDRRPAVSCGVENLLAYPGDPYAEESIAVHELGHAIHQMGVNSLDPTFDDRLKAAYDAAMAAGLWKDTYAASNKNEYWAEGVQNWFDTNRTNDSQHNHINTREEIKEYDPRLSALLKEVFGDSPWRYRRLQDRAPGEMVHLRGWDPAKAPAFVWPKALLEWRRENRRPLSSSREYVAVKLNTVNAANPASSENGGHDTVLHFFNARKTEVEIWWVDAKGARHSYGRVAPDGDMMQQTFAGHAWLVTDSTGMPVGHCVAPERAGKVVIE